MKYEINIEGIIIEGAEGNHSFANIQELERIQQAIKDSQTKLNNKKIRVLQESKNTLRMEKVSEMVFTNGMKIVGNSNGIFIVRKNKDVVAGFLNYECQIIEKEDGKIAIKDPSGFYELSSFPSTFSSINAFWKTLI